MTENETIWLKAGYETFALQGRSSLKVETLARRVGVSKSSFYHYFADLELFVERLLRLHLQQSEAIASKERSVQNIDPELIEVLVEHKIDLLFNRQLRIAQTDPRYKATLLQSNQIVGHEFVNIWARDLQLQLNKKQLEGLFELALENFYLQINAENLNYDWLSHYFKNLRRIALRFV